MKPDNPLRGRVDWVLVGAILGLVLVGSVAILSAAAPLPYYGQIMRRHFTALGGGILLFIFGLSFNYQVYQDQGKLLYAFILALLIAVLIWGVELRGTRGWFALPFLSFQPSEVARLGTVLVLANILDRRAKSSHTVGYLISGFLVAVPVMALILLQPDFSSTLPFFPMLFGMLFCGGANILHLLAMGTYAFVALILPLLWTLLSLRPSWIADSVILGAFIRLRDFDFPLLLAVLGIFLAAYLVWQLSVQLRLRASAPLFGVAAFILASGLATGAFLDHQLKGYQRNRFVAFLVPDVDPRGAAYNVQQAQISIGSGGLWGKGVFSGTQSKLGFLPERHTDFIYAVIGEEMGFLGTMWVLGLYSLLLWRIVNTARASRDRYGYLICCGMAAVTAFYLIVNVGMCIGLVPVAGVPLPLVSYGGSSLAITLFGFGIVANIYSRRYSFYS